MKVVKHPRTGDLFDVLMQEESFWVFRSHRNGDVFAISSDLARTFVSMTHPSVRKEL